jgi:hypothetical protein
MMQSIQSHLYPSRLRLWYVVPSRLRAARNLAVGLALLDTPQWVAEQCTQPRVGAGFGRGQILDAVSRHTILSSIDSTNW